MSEFLINHWQNALVIFLAVSCSFVLSHVLTVKEKKSSDSWMSIALMCLFAGLICAVWILNHPEHSILILLLLCIASIFYFRFIEKLPAVISCFAGTLVSLFFSLLYSYSTLLLYQLPVRIVLYIAVILIIICAEGFGWSIFPKHTKEHLYEGSADEPSRLFWYLWAVTIALLFAAVGILYLDAYGTSSFQRHVLLLLFHTVLSIVLLILHKGSAAALVNREEILIDQKYQADLLSFMQVIRSQRHDFNLHMNALKGLIDQGKYEECADYISSMTKNASKTNDAMLVKIPALGAMLGTFQEIALQKDIDLTLDIQNSMELVPCTVYELNTIVGNLVQNAIDEVENKEKEDRNIQVLLLRRSGNNVIRVTNPFHGDPETLKEVTTPGFTTKKAHEGIGLTTVQRILSRYGGVVYPEFKNETVSFIAQFPFSHQSRE